MPTAQNSLHAKGAYSVLLTTWLVCFPVGTLRQVTHTPVPHSIQLLVFLIANMSSPEFAANYTADSCRSPSARSPLSPGGRGPARTAQRSGLCPVVGKLEAGERPHCICCSPLLGPWRCPDTTPRLWVFPPGGEGVGPGAKLGPGRQEKGTSRHGFLTQLDGWQGPEPKQSVRPEVQG